MGSGRRPQTALFTLGVSLMPEDFANRLHTPKENRWSPGRGWQRVRAWTTGGGFVGVKVRCRAVGWCCRRSGGLLSAWTESRQLPSALQSDGILAGPTGAAWAGCRRASCSPPEPAPYDEHWRWVGRRPSRGTSRHRDTVEHLTASLNAVLGAGDLSGWGRWVTWPAPNRMARVAQETGLGRRVFTSRCVPRQNLSSARCSKWWAPSASSFKSRPRSTRRAVSRPGWKQPRRTHNRRIPY